MHGSIQQFEFASTAWLEKRGVVRRKLHIYLPPSYPTATERRYPVLYMHYGQHIFAPSYSGHEAWKVHETVERLLATEQIEELIIVGIAADRETVSSDYWHYGTSHSWQSTGGAAYERFIVDELKPWVDHTFRTLSDQKNTAILGASAGGLASFNIAQNNPTLFGKVGMLSSVIRSHDNDEWLFRQPLSKPTFTLWVDVGDAEGVYTSPVRDFVDQLLAIGLRPSRDFFYYLEADAAHLDSYWAARMIHPLLLFFGKRGNAIKVELQGDTQVGMESAPLLVNPVVTFDSGFKMSLLDGKYQIAGEPVLRAEPTGRFYGCRTGEAQITLRYEHLSVTRSYQVTEPLADSVCIQIRAYVPEPMPNTNEIHLGKLALQRVETRKMNSYYYEGKFVLPRGFALKANFTCGMRAFERKTDGEPAPLRYLKATKDGIVEYTIERWPKDSQER